MRPETAEQEQHNAPIEKTDTKGKCAERGTSSSEDHTDIGHDHPAGETATEEAKQEQRRQLESGEENPT